MNLVLPAGADPRASSGLLQGAPGGHRKIAVGCWARREEQGEGSVQP